MSGSIRIVDETGSTNADLAQAIRAGENPAEGDWLVARRQTAGKGRQGREWFDGEGNFMGSTVVPIAKSDPPAPSLSFVAAIALLKAIHYFLGGGLEARLKWPNDVVVNDGKISGILLESVESHVVIGIGVNLSRAPQLPDRKTVALADLVSAPEVETFANVLANELAKVLGYWRDFGFLAIIREFEEQSIHRVGAPISVHDTDGSRVDGSFVGLDQTDGALRLRLADGSERVIRAGDVS